MRKSGAVAHLVLTLFCSIAVRTEAGVTVDEDEPNVEVCRFRSGPADGPFDRWLYSQQLVCTGPSSVAFTEGRWNVFARSGSGISLEPLLVDSEGPELDAVLRLAPAATLELQLPTGQSGVVYAPKHAIAFPAGEKMSIPAGQELWLIVLENSYPTGVVTIPPTAAGTTRTVDAREGGKPSLLAWLQAPEADRRAFEKAGSVPPPRIVIDAGGKQFAVGTLPSSAALDGAILLAQRVAEGPAELQLSGRGWLPSRQRFIAGPDQVTLVHQPLALRASATLTVNWSAPDNLADLDARLGSCEKDEPPSFTLTLSRCASSDGGDDVDEASCMPVHNETLDPHATVGSSAVEDVTPGYYRAELRFGKLPPETRIAQLAPLQREPVNLQMHYRTVYGSLTRGGATVDEDAAISFEDAGYGFAPGGDEDYFGVLNGRVETDSRIAIQTCEGDRVFVYADGPIHPLQRFDINIPENELRIEVTDTFTREPLRKATLRYRILSRSHPRRTIESGTLPAHRRGAPSDSEQAEEPGDGTFVMEALPERELRIIVSHPGYRKQELPPFSMEDREKKIIEVQLVPLRGSQGKIDSARGFEDATIFWYSAEGFQTERADLEADGTFFYEERHGEDETITIVSSSHPLWITRAPVVDGRRPLQLRFPDRAPVVDVMLTGRGMPVLSIGRLTVPATALRAHLTLRNLHLPFDHIPAVADTGRVEVTFSDPPR